MKRDAIIIGGCLLLAAGIMLWNFASGGKITDGISAESYIEITVGDEVYPPMPLTEDRTYAITQENGDQNVLHMGKDSVCMQSATCKNQDCVHQGILTPDNRETRTLRDMIICLPNRVTVRLMTAQEARQTMEADDGQ